MKVRKYTDDQIKTVLFEAESDAKFFGLCQKYGVSDNTCYNYKTKYAGLNISETSLLVS